MRAVECKYIGPTNYRSSRIKASAGKGISVTIPYPYELSGEDVYKAAALALIEKMGWQAEGGIKGGYTDAGMVFVSCNRKHSTARAALRGLPACKAVQQYQQPKQRNKHEHFNQSDDGQAFSPKRQNEAGHARYLF